MDADLSPVSWARIYSFNFTQGSASLSLHPGLYASACSTGSLDAVTENDRAYQMVAPTRGLCRACARVATAFWLVEPRVGCHRRQLHWLRFAVEALAGRPVVTAAVLELEY